MSYLITSNIPTDEIQQKDGINKPFAYFNNLQNTHIIPANSEIAVESCKIVKDGKISVHRENNVFYFYYGEKLSDTKPIEDTLYHPIRAAIYANGQTADAAQVNVDDFASMLDDTVRRSLYHPNLQPSSINTISSKCTVKRDTNPTINGLYPILFKSLRFVDNPIAAIAIVKNIFEEIFIVLTKSTHISFPATFVL